MFYSNKKLRKSSTSALVNFTNFEKSMNTQTDEALLPYKSAKISYNFNVKKGALCTGYGFKDFTLPKINSDDQRTIVTPGLPIKQIWKYKCYNQVDKREDPEVLFIDSEGQIYFVMVHDNAPLSYPLANTEKFLGIPNAINYRLNSQDTLIFSSEQDGMWTYALNNGLTKIENAPHIVSMCLHYERLFAVVGGERNRLAFSANLDPTDWSEDLSSGGFIEMQDERGTLTKVVSYNDYVYVFREYGVSKVSAYGDQTDFSVSHLFVSSVKLYGNTVTVCGNKILLLTRDGIHSFDGYSAHKLDLGIDDLFKDVKNDNACGVYFKNKFLLACRLNFNDGEQIGCENYSGGYVNNALIELDLVTNEISITRGVDIASMVVLDDQKFAKVAICFNGEYSARLGELCEDGCIFGEPLQKKWISPKSNMGYPTKIKHIKECLIKTKSPCTITIATDKQKKSFSVSGKETSQRVKLNMIGEQVEVAFEARSTGETYISCPQISLSIGN